MLLAYLRSRAGWDCPPSFAEGRVRLFTGDRFELNKGEVWQWVS